MDIKPREMKLVQTPKWELSEPRQYLGDEVKTGISAQRWGLWNGEGGDIIRRLYYIPDWNAGKNDDTARGPEIALILDINDKVYCGLAYNQRTDKIFSTTLYIEFFPTQDSNISLFTVPFVDATTEGCRNAPIHHRPRPAGSPELFRAAKYWSAWYYYITRYRNC